jgi:WD40 repeat protein
VLGADHAVERHEPLGEPRAFGQFAPAHDAFAVFEGSPAVQLRRLSDGALLREVPPSGSRLQSLRFDPRGRWCAVAGDDGQVQLAPLDPLAPSVRFASSESALNALAFDATGERMALTLHGAGAELWRLDPPQLERTLALPSPSTGRLAWSPDGRELAVALRGARVCVLSTVSGELRFEFEATASVGVLYWPFDHGLFVADLEGVITRVERASARTSARMLGHEGPVTALTLDPAGRWLASSGFDGFVRVWDASSGVELAHFDPKAGAARGVAFSPDGTRLWAHFADGVARGWRLDVLRARVERNRPVQR